ncbi:MAG: phenylacetate--CoA ligase family protein [Myxococcota bacterium]
MAGFRRPFEAVDHAALARTHPPPPEYFEGDWLLGPEEIEARQLERLRARARRAHEVPFFRKRWDAAGFHPDQLDSLADLSRAPAYRVDDIRRSIEEHPPLGDYQGASLDRVLEEPLRIFMSGATTGAPRPTLYTQWDREAGAILMARALYLQGVRPGDVVINAWAYSTHNGAFAFDEALHKWLNCVVITTGTGTVTSSRRQVELAHQYQATAILTTGDYLMHLASVAKEMGLDPKKDFNLKALPNIGDRDVLEEAWGVPNYQSYGFHEVQWVSVECPERQGLHVFEDAFVVQIVDPETGEVLPDGEQGCVCITEIYKTGSPQFRYDIQDLSFLYPRERCACGSWLRRMGPFAGRADNMVKLRGVNVWPEAVGEIALDDPRLENDYFVRAVREAGRDEMIVHLVSRADASQREPIRLAAEARLKERLGVRIGAVVAAPGELDAWTEIHSSPKPKRFRDERGG